MFSHEMIVVSVVLSNVARMFCAWRFSGSPLACTGLNGASASNMTAVRITARRPPFCSAFGLPIISYVAFVRYDYVASQGSKLTMYGANGARQFHDRQGLFSLGLRQGVLAVQPLDFTLGLQESNAERPNATER